MSIELKPCPFCGRNPRIHVLGIGGATIECEDDNCLAGDTLQVFDSVADAVEA